MKLRALELEQFRKFERPVRLSGFSDRVNVLFGPNEFGKSTILAAIRAVMFERHNSRAEPIKAMQSWRGNAAPRLAMEFETGGGVWRIEKRFLHQPSARLTAPDGGRFDGDAAEETLQRLLGFGASGKQGAKAEHMGVWGALWVTQRESVQQADLTADLTRATVTDCLDAEVGVLTGSEKGQAMMRAARAALAQLQDGNRKPRGRYREVVARIADLDGELAALRDRAARLSEDAGDLQRKSLLLAQASDPAVEADARAKLEEARRLREAALLYEERLETARSALTLAERNRDDCERETLTRQTRATALAEQEGKLATAATAEAEAREAANAAEMALATSRVGLATAQAGADAAILAGRRARDMLDHLRRAAAFATHQRIAARAEEAQVVVSGLLARQQGIRIGLPRLTAIRKAVNDRDAIRSGLHAQATQVEFDLLPDAMDRVGVGGAKPPSARHAVTVVEDIEITIAGIGRLRVRPAIRDRDKLILKLQRAEDALRAALSDTGCADPADAERRWTEREGLERDLVAARAELARLAPGDDAAGLAPGAAALREHVDLLGRRLQEERAVFGDDPLPGLEEASAAASAAPALERETATALLTARADLEAALAARSDARDGLTKAAGLAERCRAELARLRAEADEAERREPAAALAARLDAATGARLRAAAEHAARERERPEHTAEAMQARIERYEQMLSGREQQKSKLAAEIAGLRARIKHEGGQGLDEQVAAAERERDALGREQEGCAREIRVLTLLLDTLAAAERETKERYLVPVIRRVTPYLRTLFPRADIACDDALRITGLIRADLGSQEFDRLSDGTQEQIAVLARLAFAEMLVDRGKPAMVILDDALAYSDAGRMERMFDILTQAAAKTQVLVLTCREDLFARLGGSRIEVERQDGASPAHAAARLASDSP